MIVRFCLYSIFKNLRFADPFLILFLLHLDYSLTAIFTALGLQNALTAVLEVPLALVADRYGRRSALAACFVCYALSFASFARLTPGGWVLLSFALFWFGLGEALRTGSHKAIMLDYLDGRGESHRATAVIGLTRAFSKSSAGLSALAGGLLLYRFESYAPLFWLSAAAATAGFALMLTYPSQLEGEQRRQRHERTDESQPTGLGQRWAALTASAGVVTLVVQSTVFESQAKLILSYYLQPFLKQGLAAWGIAVVGTGALAIGVIELVREGTGAVGARLSDPIASRVGSLERALAGAYGLCLASTAAVGAFAYFDLLWPGVAVAVLLTLLQNARRPVFVSAFNRLMDKPQRATSLSIESWARSLSISALLPLSGWLADHVGLWAAFALGAALLAAAWLLPSLPAAR